MDEKFTPTVGKGCFFGEIPVKLVACYSTEFGKGKVYLAQRTVPSTKEVYNTRELIWEKVPCEAIEESMIWEKDLTEKPVKAGKEAK
jgi:hypothetical protein